MVRPFEVLLHKPAIALPAGELGARIRFDSEMADAQRELVILTAATEHKCEFEWESHLPIAQEAGVRQQALEAIRRGSSADLTEEERTLVEFTQELCRTSTVADSTFRAAADLLGTTGVVELAATVGYYTFLGYVMNASGAC
jgi:4-carboxymuconolactone decarboxylase